MLLDSVSFQIAVVEEAQMKGSITGILYFDGTNWMPLPPNTSVPLTQALRLAVGYVNQGNVGDPPFVGHVDLNLTRPDGSKVIPIAVWGQDLQADPGSGWYVEFLGVPLDQAGTWSGLAELSGTWLGATARLAQSSFTIAIGAEEGNPWVIGLLGGALAVGGALAGLKIGR